MFKLNIHTLLTTTAISVCVGCTPEELPSSTAESPSLRLRMPIEEVELLFPTSMGVDHDPTDYPSGVDAIHCTAYDGRGFPACYDGHDGTDYELSGGFPAMDDGSATVVAAAAGEVIRVVDGNYDRCRLDISTFEPTCDGYPMKSNLVEILHETGEISGYFHLMKGSVAVEVGQWVEQGAPLGLVGSSGRSTTPHLHFEVEDANGKSFDPYAGEYSQEESFWCEQNHSSQLPGKCEAD